MKKTWKLGGISKYRSFGTFPDTFLRPHEHTLISSAFYLKLLVLKIYTWIEI